jgi:hypothetical protein
MRMVGAPRAPAIEVPRCLTLGRRLQRPAGPAECGYPGRSHPWRGLAHGTRCCDERLQCARRAERSVPPTTERGPRSRRRVLCHGSDRPRDRTCFQVGRDLRFYSSFVARKAEVVVIPALDTCFVAIPALSIRLPFRHSRSGCRSRPIPEASDVRVTGKAGPPVHSDDRPARRQMHVRPER